VRGTWATCYASYRPTSTPRRDVTRLGLLCGPENGLKLVGETIEGDVTEVAVERTVEFDAGECVRVFSVAEPSAVDFSIEVRDAKGVPVAVSGAPERWSVLLPDGPLCVKEAGRYGLWLRAGRGAGRYALQVCRLP
jgi:hypothetical protein